MSSQLTHYYREHFLHLLLELRAGMTLQVEGFPPTSVFCWELTWVQTSMVVVVSAESVEPSFEVKEWKINAEP